MKCIRKKCRGTMRVVRTATGTEQAFQDRQCDLCGASKVYIVQAYEGDQVDVRTLLKRIEGEE